MRAVGRRVAKACLLAALAATGFAAWILRSNELLLDRRYPAAPVSLPVAAGPEAVQRGRHLADVTGCTDCHGPDLRGRAFIDEGWWRGRYYASNLTRKAQTYSDEDFARIVRQGVRPDGRGVVAMPAMGYVRLSDAEMADLVAFIRSLPAGGPVQPAHRIGPLDHWDLWIGRTLKPAIAYVADEQRKTPADAGPGHDAARHLAGIVCAECHGGDLAGNGWDSGAPDLAVAAAYSVEQLLRLLRTGIGADGKTHRLMTLVSRDRLHKLSDDEIAGLHAYLVARAAGAR